MYIVLAHEIQHLDIHLVVHLRRAFQEHREQSCVSRVIQSTAVNRQGLPCHENFNRGFLQRGQYNLQI